MHQAPNPMQLISNIHLLSSSPRHFLLSTQLSRSLRFSVEISDLRPSSLSGMMGVKGKKGAARWPRTANDCKARNMFGRRCVGGNTRAAGLGRAEAHISLRVNGNGGGGGEGGSSAQVSDRRRCWWALHQFMDLASTRHPLQWPSHPRFIPSARSHSRRANLPSTP